ncbi:MAG: carbohydrate ABC transporter permease [Nakamurella sp.]
MTPVTDTPRQQSKPTKQTKGTETATAGSAGSRFLVGYVPLILATLLIGLPLLWLILSSFKEQGEILTNKIVWFPSTFYFGNYERAFQIVPFGRVFLNSVIVTVIGAGLKVILAVISAYALVFVRFPFRNTIFMLILVALMVPAEIAIVPNYILVAGIGGVNTYWGIILPTLGTAFGTFLLRQQFLMVPTAISEAAEIDGASHWVRMTRVIVPMRRSAVITLVLIYLVVEWNQYLWPLVIINDPKMMTLPVGLTLLQNTEPGSTAWGVLMAGAVLVILPILIVFIALQKHIVTGLTQGAVKG